MAEFIIGKDIFKEPGDLYVIPVNTVGVMGAGLAKAFAELQPDLFLKYKHDCKMKIITIGHPTVYSGSDGKKYMMFPTKENWRNGPLYPYIAEGLMWLVNNIGEEEGEVNPNWKIVFPPLGCGLGGLDFSVVGEMIKDISDKIPNTVVVITPPWMVAPK